MLHARGQLIQLHSQSPEKPVVSPAPAAWVQCLKQTRETYYFLELMLPVVDMGDRLRGDGPRINFFF